MKTLENTRIRIRKDLQHSTQGHECWDIEVSKKIFRFFWSPYRGIYKSVWATTQEEAWVKALKQVYGVYYYGK